MTKFVIIGLAAIIGIGSILFFKKTDNPVEQVAEQIIKSETGLDIDLSPESGS